jgi:magnesium transporter
MSSVSNNRANDALDDPVTRHMRSDFAQLNVEQSVGEALDAVRRNPPGGRVIYFYVVDAELRLCGVVPTRRLLLASTDTPLREIMVTKVVALPPEATVLEACEFFTLHRLLAFPVVDRQGRILGVVDVELYTGEREELERSERNDDLFQLIGVRLIEARQAHWFGGFLSRYPWLMANVAGGLAAAFLAGRFEREMQNVALALFIPVVLALAESVSMQSVSLTLQMLRGHEPSTADLLRKLRAEAFTGLLLGLGCAALVALVAFAWRGDANVAFCLLGGIAGGVTCAALIGVAMPCLLRMLQREPQVAAGPIALAASDMATLLIYLSLARWLLG